MPFTYAIADLHGRYDLLSEAVAKIVEHSKSDRPATIITLGDYVDRGPKSRQVIEPAVIITGSPGQTCLTRGCDQKAIAGPRPPPFPQV
jgi:Calcineurin-like phosphoesterase